jgi:S1-C subfamily serine protease
MRTWALTLCIVVAACAPQPGSPESAARLDSLVPGSIGVLVREEPAGLVVAALRKDGPAALSGLRTGDVLLRYNGAPVSRLREFNRRVIDTPPGSIARIDLLRDGDERMLEIPVGELDVMPRV